MNLCSGKLNILVSSDNFVYTRLLLEIFNELKAKYKIPQSDWNGCILRTTITLMQPTENWFPLRRHGFRYLGINSAWKGRMMSKLELQTRIDNNFIRPLFSHCFWYDTLQCMVRLYNVFDISFSKTFFADLHFINIKTNTSFITVRISLQNKRLKKCKCNWLDIVLWVQRFCKFTHHKFRKPRLIPDLKIDCTAGCLVSMSWLLRLCFYLINEWKFIK